jgi:hypothetical protein
MLAVFDGEVSEGFRDFVAWLFCGMRGKLLTGFLNYTAQKHCSSIHAAFLPFFQPSFLP